MKIGILDSGLGGLTVLKSLMKHYPHHEYIYFGDTLHLPYGEKKAKEVISYGNKIIHFLEEQAVDIIVIACGTLSSNITKLQSSKPLIDLISPLNNMLDKYQSVAVIATPLTIKINAFKKYIHTKLILRKTPALVPIIESNDYTNLDSVLQKYLHNLKSEALLLGCTHYPLIKDDIAKYYKGDIITLDTFILDKFQNLKETDFNLKLYFSKLNDDIIKNVKRILEIDNLDIERKCLE